MGIRYRPPRRSGISSRPRNTDHCQEGERIPGGDVRRVLPARTWEANAFEMLPPP